MSRVRTFIATEFLMLAGLLAYVGLAYGIEVVVGIDGPISLNALSAVVMAALPGILWLGYFYSQDRHEPEPKAFVAGSYLLGAFVAGPCSAFLVDVALSSSTSSIAPLSLGALGAERWIAAIAIVGMSHELCKYTVVRYTLYTSPEFDEPVDGIIYASAAGIGFATYESVTGLLADSGQVFLSAAAAQCVVTTLAHASFAGVVGFALGRAKFSMRRRAQRSLLLVAGLVGASVLNGGFHITLDALSLQGLGSAPWRRVVFSFAFATAAFLFITFLIRWMLKRSPHRPASEEAARA